MNSTGRYRAFIWDFDGTLFNTYPQTVNAYLQVLAEYGIEESAGEIERYARISLGELERYLRSKYDVHHDFFGKVGEKRRELEGGFSEPFPEAAKFVREAAAAGALNLLYSHRDKMAVDMLKRSGLWEYFADAIVAGDEGFAWKPSPDSVVALLSRNGVEKSEAIMVGDREIDVLSGKNAGIDSCLIMPYDLSAPTAATYLAADFAEFEKILGAL